ncbi:uncharacterized protein BT62DRAFT_12513 [Guyanagaster necrorhizus]|uniref:Uncharacterized protein n=1 Tax=Guyanagaster necrorhizus TaxID=856835 RepID=A0A9P8AYG0_9AGAR|nr:uncharacterized protein BT62DRAFT_12513 [Guyanagaster necrorhizus MCA 3950]KAG7452613.1 hypothetical protein BT62DRAFT_12513 [Guyanagaster necrorhizus MCA 3950]
MRAVGPARGARMRFGPRVPEGKPCDVLTCRSGVDLFFTVCTTVDRCRERPYCCIYVITMQHIYVYTRYAFVGLFLVFNAINASVSVWNLSLIQLIGLTYPLDIYLTVVGACGLAMSFLIVFVEAAYDNPITGRVWFECAWVGLFLVMNFCGAVALSALNPAFCTSDARRQIGDIGCVSNRVILAFSWITIMLLFGYFTMLAITCLIRQKTNTKIWQYHIRDLDTPSSHLPSPPASPTIPYFRNAIVAPLPRRPGPPVNMMRGLDSSYDVEAYEPQLARAPRNNFASQPMFSTSNQAAVTCLYPQYIQSCMVTPSRMQTQEPPCSQPNNTPPPPLGDWPRADILSRPLRAVHKQSRREPLPDPDDAYGSTRTPHRLRPTGPRIPSTRTRPPQLDLHVTSPTKGKERRRQDLDSL